MIIIDPGHGGSDSGAVGSGGTLEKEINLKVSKLIQFFLKYLGYDVKSTRNGDYLPSWKDRVKSKDDDIFVSVHCNSAVDPSIIGVETLYYSGSKEGKSLAESIQKELMYNSIEIDRGVKQRKDLYVLKNTSCPAVLVELGFISNPETEKKLNDSQYQLNLAASVVEGIISAVKSEKNPDI